MRYLFRPPATDGASLLPLPWHLPLEEWDPALLLDVPQRGISRHVVRFVPAEGHVYALKEITERLARHEYALLGQFEGEGLPTVSVLGICVDRPGELPAVLVTRYLEYSLSYRYLFSRPTGEHSADQLLDTMVVLLVRLHLADFYWGDDARGAPAGKLGNLQQVMTPPAGLLAHVLPKPVADALAPAVAHLTGLLSVAEDQPREANGVRVDASSIDPFGLPKLLVHHHYTPRDRAARRALVRRAKQVLRRAGAWGTVTWNVSTFSHAVGTVRMGADERTSPLDPDCRYRGLENLYVTDGSVFPTSAGVNPSLTIAANALRVGRRIAGAGSAASADAGARGVPA